MDHPNKVPKTTLFNGSIPTIVITYDSNFNQETMFKRWGYDGKITNNNLSDYEPFVVSWPEYK